jgi:hypothetical protein
MGYQKEAKDDNEKKKKHEVWTSTPMKKSMGTQEGEIRKNIKYHKNPPVLTII